MWLPVSLAVPTAYERMSIFKVAPEDEMALADMAWVFWTFLRPSSTISFCVWSAMLVLLAS